MQRAEKWRRDAPDDFVFALKAWQVVTHRCTSPTYRRITEELPDPEGCGWFQPSVAVKDAWERTLEFARALESPLVLFQCPKSFTPEPEAVANLRWFFDWAERDEITFLWEPRGWPPDLVKELCAELDLVHCVDPFIDEQVYGDIVYWRLHGRPAYQYRYHYTDADLVQLKSITEGAAARYQRVYVMFNNWWLGEDGMRFRALL